MPVVIRQIFDVQTGDISQYHAHMLDFIDNACPKRDNISVVGPHRGTEDWNWAYVELRVGGTKMVVLAICMDTLYLYAWKKGGFESENPWLCFARESPVGLEGVNEELPFNGNYRTLGDPHNVVVNRPSLVNSVFTIHDSPSSEASKPALLILILVFCASIRIKSIYQFLLDALSDDHRHQLLRMDSQREKNWKKASDHYLRGRAIFIEGYEIVSHDTISQELSVLLWSVGESYDFPSSRGWIPLEPLKKEDDKYKNGSKEDSRRHNKGKRNSQYLTSRQRARMETTGRRRQPNILNETSNASKERSQVSFSPSKLERYLGTVREENTFNIPLEFVPGGSVSSLLSNFGSFPESGVSILFDNKGCIHLADFGASKQVAKPATMIAAISMKGTPYWMVPEVISLTGHRFSADIWSSTVIEMATSKPPWYQEVAALFHVGATKSHPPIPEDLALEANDFLLKCLQEEPGLHPTSSDLLQHPFLMEESEDVKQLNRSGSKESCNNVLSTNKTQTSNFCTIMNHDKIFLASPLWETSNYDDDDMCQLDDGNDFLLIGLIFNPVSEPWEEWPCKFDISPKQRRVSSQHLGKLAADHYDINRRASKIDCSDANWFSFPTDAACEDDDEVTGSKIRAFLDEKALDLKKLQTPLYEEFQNTLNASNAKVISSVCKEEISNNSNNKTANAPKLPPMTPSKISSAASPTMLLPSGFSRNFIPGSSFSQPISRYSMCGSCVLQEITSPPKMYEQVPPEHHSDITEPMTTSTNVSDLRENGKKNPPRSLKD